MEPWRELPHSRLTYAVTATVGALLACHPQPVTIADIQRHQGFTLSYQTIHAVLWRLRVLGWAAKHPLGRGRWAHSFKCQAAATEAALLGPGHPLTLRAGRDAFPLEPGDLAS